MNTHTHYETHLARFYAWMAGDFDDKMQEQLDVLRQHGVESAPGKRAIDLGCGHGLQTMALAKLGFQVTAVDFSAQLLSELSARIGSESIDLVEADIISFLKRPLLHADVITCMGDTLTHLASVHDVHTLIECCHKALAPQGKLVLSFRDLSEPLMGSDRFLPIRSDHNRIHTCFLEFFDDHVMVHDILNEYAENRWKQTVSAYPKLRLTSAYVAESINRYGFSVEGIVSHQRMTYIFAVRR